LRQLFGSHREAGRVAARIGKFTQPVKEPERVKDRRIDADTDG
jgi:hypothetical protein